MNASEIIIFAAKLLGIPAISTGVGKLLETVASQANLLMEPSHIRRKAAAAVTRALGTEQEMSIENRSMEERAIARVRLEAIRHQSNIESVIAQAAAEIPETVASEPVDTDWVSQFFDHCQDVGNPEMQRIWARLLAGEVAKPGTFSLRTLATVKQMQKRDAELFTLFVARYGFIAMTKTTTSPRLTRSRSTLIT